ncbi:hypothetical protein [Candidatus Pelagisphaera phototrophica]|uniref:hypothetical protein n=1 Tax=Candidatus Pelagisphaera phototrophica TaxID=2684113 RepID=UPI0019E336D5|nr:hypothetical protein [Candidatus Pelagisphaera phototrophica]QXD31452.1 hypothetical protein GA004_14135 [Candidatus Pelagisphaera phototrophica]
MRPVTVRLKHVSDPSKNGRCLINPLQQYNLAIGVSNTAYNGEPADKMMDIGITSNIHHEQVWLQWIFWIKLNTYEPPPPICIHFLRQIKQRVPTSDSIFNNSNMSRLLGNIDQTIRSGR